MNYLEKYSKIKVGVVIKADDDFLIKSHEQAPCTICGEQTAVVDIFSEMHICSDECLAKLNEDIEKKCYSLYEIEEGEDC